MTDKKTLSTIEDFIDSVDTMGIRELIEQFREDVKDTEFLDHADEIYNDFDEFCWSMTKLMARKDGDLDE